MIYVFNKNKIFSYIIASFLVLLLFVFSASMIPNDNVELLKVSANTMNHQNFYHNDVIEE